MMIGSHPACIILNFPLALIAGVDFPEEPAFSETDVIVPQLVSHAQ